MPQIHHIAFNNFQGGLFIGLVVLALILRLDVFAVAGDFGIRVFNAYPLVELVNLKADAVGSIKTVALLNRTNLIFMVAGEPYPKFSTKALMVWDNEKEKFTAEITVNSPILNVLVSLSRWAPWLLASRLRDLILELSLCNSIIFTCFRWRASNW